MRREALIAASDAAWQRFLNALARKDQKGMERETANMHRIAAEFTSKEDGS
jgi:hypothetical protein